MIDPQWLKAAASIIGVIISVAGLTWGVGRSLISAGYKSRRDIEQQKIALQRELEKEKQRHFTKAIDGLKKEIEQLFSKVNALSNDLGRYEERLKALNSNMKTFVDSAEKRCEAVEQEVKMYRQQTEDYAREVRTLKIKGG